MRVSQTSSAAVLLSGVVFAVALVVCPASVHAQTVTRVVTTINIVGTAGPDICEVAFIAPNQVLVTLNGTPYTFLRSQVRLVDAQLGDGDDIFVGTSCPFNLTVDGGAGNDSLTGGKSGDTLIGSGGNDTILGNAGLDSCEGGAGNDYIDGGQSDDGLDGGTGRDVLVGGGGTDSLNGGTAEDLLIAGFLASGSVANVKAVWFDLNLTFDNRIAAFSLVPPVTTKDSGADLMAGGTGRDLFLGIFIPPVLPTDPPEDLKLDFVLGVDADSVLPPTL